MSIGRPAAKKSAPKKALPAKKAAATYKSGLAMPTKTIAVKVKPYDIDISELHYSDNPELTITANNDEVFVWSPTLENTDISCGVNQFSGLPENSEFQSSRKALGDKFEDVLDEAFVKLFTYIKEHDNSHYNCAFIMMSNTTDRSCSIINDCFDRICMSTPVRRNPNSTNNIKVWIY